MNKIFQILSVLVFAFGVVGCGSGGKTPASLIVNSNTGSLDRIIESTDANGATYTFTLRNPPKTGNVQVEVSFPRSHALRGNE